MRWPWRPTCYAWHMKTFVRAVVTGFAFTLGATLFRKFAKKVGLDEEQQSDKAEAKTAQASEPAMS